MNDDSSASFNSQISGVFRIAGTDCFVAIADRWVPYYVVTKEKYEVLLRAISQHSDHSVKVSFKEKIMLLTSPIMGSADTSIADYVWLPIEWEGEKPVIQWKDSWDPREV